MPLIENYNSSHGEEESVNTIEVTGIAKCALHAYQARGMIIGRALSAVKGNDRGLTHHPRVDYV